MTDGGRRIHAGVAALELRRARKRLGIYCQRRGWRTHGGGWDVRLCDEMLEVYTRADGNAVFRLDFQQGCWRLYAPAADGDWHAYPHPALTGLDEVIDELERAPLHVHW